MHLLAESSFDWFKAFQIVWSSVMTYFLFRMGQYQRKNERAEDERNATVSGMKKELSIATEKLHETATKLVDERFRAMSHELNNHVNGLVLAIDETKERLKARDGIVSELGERDHKLELQVLGRLNEIKTYVVEHAASKKDLREHQDRMDSKVEKINERLAAQDRQLAVIERVVNRSDERGVRD